MLVAATFDFDFSLMTPPGACLRFTFGYLSLRSPPASPLCG